MTIMRKDGKMVHQKLLKKRHNKLKRRIELNMAQVGDKEKLIAYKKLLGYKDSGEKQVTNAIS